MKHKKIQLSDIKLENFHENTLGIFLLCILFLSNINLKIFNEKYIIELKNK